MLLADSHHTTNIMKRYLPVWHEQAKLGKAEREAMRYSRATGAWLTGRGTGSRMLSLLLLELYYLPRKFDTAPQAARASAWPSTRRGTRTA